MNNQPPILFAPPELAHAAPYIGAALGGADDGAYSWWRFPNGELTLAISSDVKRRECVILATIAPPDENILTTLLLADTLSRNGAVSVAVILPYFAYARHDKGLGGEALTFPLLGRLFHAAGITRLITIDLHNPAAIPLYPVELISISPAPLFAAALSRLAREPASIAAPDAGARHRAIDLANALGTSPPIVFGRKTRGPSGIAAIIEGRPRETAIIIDDIFDTGRTVIETVRTLRTLGMKRAVVCATHGLFTGTAWLELWDLGVERIYTTDSVGRLRIPSDARIEIIPSAPLIAQSIARSRRTPSQRNANV